MMSLYLRLSLFPLADPLRVKWTPPPQCCAALSDTHVIAERLCVPLVGLFSFPPRQCCATAIDLGPLWRKQRRISCKEGIVKCERMMLFRRFHIDYYAIVCQAMCLLLSVRSRGSLSLFFLPLISCFTRANRQITRLFPFARYFAETARVGVCERESVVDAVGLTALSLPSRCLPPPKATNFGRHSLCLSLFA